MEHYIKVDNYTFDRTDPTKLNISLYFDTLEGSDTTPNRRGFYVDLKFKSVAIDTDKSFICSSEPSSIATVININDIGTQRDERYRYYDGNDYVTSSRRIVEIHLDLSDTSLNGVLSTIRSFNDTLLFFFVEVEGMEDSDGNKLDYNAVEGSYIWEQPKSIMFSLYNPIALHNFIYESMLSSMDLSCCQCIDCSSANNVVFLNGFESSIHLGRWRDSIKFWNLIHDRKYVNNKGCNCR